MAILNRRNEKTVKMLVEVPITKVKEAMALDNDGESTLLALLASSSYEELRQAMMNLPNQRLIRLAQVTHGVIYKRMEANIGKR